jgi:ubiquinone/menaquinone biosynthesis C-methylase UbiE
LDRQAAIYGTEDDLRHITLQTGAKVLDAGCGSGRAARLFALQQNSATVVGVDRNPQYVDFATRESAKQGIDNVTFRVGDVLSLTFRDAEFDLVWSKHLLQFAVSFGFFVGHVYGELVENSVGLKEIKDCKYIGQ